MMLRAAALFLLVSIFQPIPAQAADPARDKGKAPDTIAEVKKRGVLVAGVRDADPPFGFKDAATGQLEGLDVDLAREVAKRLGVKLALKPVKAADRIPALLDGSIDLIAAKMARSAERAGLVDFSAAYFASSRRILVKKALAADPGGLAGCKVAVVGKTSSGKTLATRFPAAVPVPFGDYPAAVEALRNAEVDALAGDGMVLYGLLAGLPENEYAIPEAMTLSVQEYALAVRKGEPAFLAFVNRTLDDLNRSGEARRLFDRWLRPRSADRPAGAHPSSGTASLASGVVVRKAATAGRFVVMGVKGMFRPGSEVSFYKPHGEFVGKGRVVNLYDDEVYVDGAELPEGLVSIGDAAMMNYPEAVAAQDVRAREDFLMGVKASVKEEARALRQDEAAEFRQQKEAREKYQETIALRKMELDYQYSDRDYYIVPSFTYSTDAFPGGHAGGFGRRRRRSTTGAVAPQLLRPPPVGGPLRAPAQGSGASAPATGFSGGGSGGSSSSDSRPSAPSAPASRPDVSRPSPPPSRAPIDMPRAPQRNGSRILKEAPDRPWPSR
jgi:polar amino acid transport system substrate-binding protein